MPVTVRKQVPGFYLSNQMTLSVFVPLQASPGVPPHHQSVGPSLSIHTHQEPPPLICTYPVISWEPHVFLHSQEIPSLFCSARRSPLPLHFSRILLTSMEDLRAGRALAAQCEHLAEEIKSEGPWFCYSIHPIWIKGDSILVSPTFQEAEGRAS